MVSEQFGDHPARIRNVGRGDLHVEAYHMVTHSDEEVKEHLATSLHLNSHRAASLESVAAANDEGEVVSPKLCIIVWGMLVCPASRC